MQKVAILMSTYNGEKYIKEQLESIINQTHKDIELFIRDDGSRDSTISIIKEYQDNYKWIHLYQGENLGPAKSFIDLLWSVPDDFDYYAFSDQDDVWFESKITRAVSMLDNSSGTKKIYCGTTKLVDSNLKEISVKKKKKRIRTSIGNSIIESIASGCTIMINKGFLEFIRDHNKPSQLYMHDWWIYILACISADVNIDYEPCILYRQHADNVLGNTTNIISTFKRRLINSKELKNNVINQITEIYNNYELTDEDNKLISLFVNLNWYNKLKIVFSTKIFRQSNVDSILYKVLILFW